MISRISSWHARCFCLGVVDTEAGERVSTQQATCPDLRAEIESLRARVDALDRRRADPAPARAEGGVRRPAGPRPAANPTVLLVEDADRVRQVVGEMLSMEGFRVLEAWGGREAMEIVHRHGGPIDLLLTDVVMPEMSGRELAERLTPLRPETKVVYMSGYTDPALLPSGVLEPGTVFLEKPFSSDALAFAVRGVLARSGAVA
jgi:CheY-like chemotaxis protein